jgi:hypothetical protein
VARRNRIAEERQQIIDLVKGGAMNSKGGMRCIAVPSPDLQSHKRQPYSLQMPPASTDDPIDSVNSSLLKSVDLRTPW